MSNQLGRRATRASLGEVGALPGRCRLLQCGVTQPRPQSATSFSQIWQHWVGYLCWVLLLHQFNSIRSLDLDQFLAIKQFLDEFFYFIHVRQFSVFW